jgi:predicted nucleic-acid-binding protein
LKIAADTNILVRAITGDHPREAKAAQLALNAAELVAIATPAFCELVWVLSQSYKLPAADIARAIRVLLASANVAANRPAAEAGLARVDPGGDFADGVIAHEGNWLGADEFVSFDKRAVKRLLSLRANARLLSAGQ